MGVMAFANHPDLTAEDLARKATEAGYELTADTLIAVRDGWKSDAIAPATVRALAWLNGIDEEAALEKVYNESHWGYRFDNLRDLVQIALTRHRTSGRQLAFMAQRQGFKITTTTINHLKAGTYKSTPSADTLRAVAWLAGVSDEVAFTAAGQPVPGPPFAQELPPGVDNLSPKARKAVLDMLRVLVDLESSADASNAEPREQPTDIRSAGKRRNARAGQKTNSGSESETVVPLSDDAIDRLHKERWETLAAKEAPGGIAHDQNPEDT